MKLNKELQEFIDKNNVLTPPQNPREISLEELKTWFRQEKKLHCDIYFGAHSEKWEINNYIINITKTKKYKLEIKSRLYDSYEDALEIVLVEMGKLV